VGFPPSLSLSLSDWPLACRTYLFLPEFSSLPRRAPPLEFIAPASSSHPSPLVRHLLEGSSQNRLPNVMCLVFLPPQPNLFFCFQATFSMARSFFYIFCWHKVRIWLGTSLRGASFHLPPPTKSLIPERGAPTDPCVAYSPLLSGVLSEHVTASRDGI